MRLPHALSTGPRRNTGDTRTGTVSRAEFRAVANTEQQSGRAVAGRQLGAVAVVAGVARDQGAEDARVNEAQIVRAAAMRGATLAETAAALGCSVATARRRRAPGDVAKVERALPAWRMIGPEETERIVCVAAVRGATLKEAAEALGCSLGRARRIWLGLGLPVRRTGQRCAPAYLAQMERELRAGRTVGEVARDRGVTKQAVSELARRHGFPVRALRRSAGWGMYIRRSGSATAGSEGGIAGSYDLGAGAVTLVCGDCGVIGGNPARR